MPIWEIIVFLLGGLGLIALFIWVGFFQLIGFILDVILAIISSFTDDHSGGDDDHFGGGTFGGGGSSDDY